MVSACAALSPVDPTEGVLYSFNRTAQGVSFGGYDTAKINQIFDAFKADGYFDGMNYKQYTSRFLSMFSGQAVSSADARAQASRAAVQRLDGDDLARLTFFMSKQGQSQPRFLLERIQDGTLQAAIDRIKELSPRAVSAPAPQPALA